ncbi:MAG: protein translocase subunit SecDF [Bacteroidales bacterium]|nr:protein translocase subunit SecDF [Bacteroidales bacterium]
MRNKGAIQLFTIVFILVCIYQLSFTLVTRKVEKQAREYAQGDPVKQRNYLDSLSSVPVYNLGVVKYTYVDCKEREIQLGLDLKGGMNVILEVSVEDMLRALSNYSTDSTFNRAIRQAKERQKVSQADFITLFAEEFQKIDPNGSLAAIFSTVELKDKINFRSSNADVIKVLRSETQAAIDNAFNIISNRIDQFGVVNPKIQRLETQGRILVELPGVTEPERVRKILQSTANLEFWLTYENSEILPSLIQANSRLREILKAERAASDSLKQTAKEPAQTREEKKTEISLLEKLEKDTTAADTGISGLESWNQQNPLFAVLRPNIDRNNAPLPGSMVGLVHVKDTGKLNYYLSLKPIKAVLPRDVRFLYSAKPWQNDPSGTLYEVHAIKVSTRDGRAPLSGDVVTSARREFGQNQSTAEVAMSMNPEGAKIWARMTSDNVGRCIAIVLDDKVQSSPRVNGPITGGHSQITGNFTIKEADDLANILKSGKLPAKAQIIQETVVGPSLGKEAIQAGIKSFIIAFLAVVLYMIFFYTAQAGLYADFALIFNVFFIMGILASLGAVLTLPGIAGIVLTLGTAVDANVLIYERIKEEIAAGKGPKLAVADGYKMAMSAIIDSNVTTLLSGVVLYVFGTGPIRGFATTLIIGILTSLFTAIFLVRLLYEWRLNRGMDVRFTNRFSKGFLKNVKVKWLEKRKIFYVVSGILITIGIISLLTRGLATGIDFTGGRSFVIRFNEPVNTLKVQEMLTPVLKGTPEVITIGQSNQIRVTTKYLIDQQGPEVDSLVNYTVYQGFKPMLGDTVSFETWNANYLMNTQKVGPTIARDITIQAIWAVLFVLVIIAVYIIIRFRNWPFGMGAIVSLLHDVLIVLGLYSLLYGIMPFSLEIDQAFIAAILTVVGYSINDTVVVYDRIREWRKLYPKREPIDVFNGAINSTLSRTFNTSMTTFLVVLIIFLFGGVVIKGFVFALLIGIFVGTYSSVFVAAPVAFDFLRIEEKRRERKMQK